MIYVNGIGLSPNLYIFPFSVQIVIFFLSSGMFRMSRVTFILPWKEKLLMVLWFLPSKKEQELKKKMLREWKWGWLDEKCEGSKKIWCWLDCDHIKNIQEITEICVIFTQSVMRKRDQNNICKILRFSSWCEEMLWYQQYEIRTNTKHCSWEGIIKHKYWKVEISRQQYFW